MHMGIDQAGNGIAALAVNGFFGGVGKIHFPDAGDGIPHPGYAALHHTQIEHVDDFHILNDHVKRPLAVDGFDTFQSHRFSSLVSVPHPESGTGMVPFHRKRVSLLHTF